MTNKFVFILVVGLLLILAVALGGSAALADDPTSCDDADCHEGIEDIRDPSSGMFIQLSTVGGCIACHGGDGTATEEEAAHSGTF